MLLIITILIDQLSKYLIRFFGGFYICNKGISFGLKVPSGIFWFLWILFIAFLICSYFESKTKHQKPKDIGISLILGGAISNILDRLLSGCVTDFIDLRIWPVFNLADVFISIGAIIIVLSAIKNKS